MICFLKEFKEVSKWTAASGSALCYQLPNLTKQRFSPYARVSLLIRTRKEEHRLLSIIKSTLETSTWRGSTSPRALTTWYTYLKRSRQLEYAGCISVSAMLGNPDRQWRAKRVLITIKHWIDLRRRTMLTTVVSGNCCNTGYSRMFRLCSSRAHAPHATSPSATSASSLRIWGSTRMRNPSNVHKSSAASPSTRRATWTNT